MFFWIEGFLIWNLEQQRNLRQMGVLRNLIECRDISWKTTSVSAENTNSSWWAAGTKSTTWVWDRFSQEQQIHKHQHNTEATNFTLNQPQNRWKSSGKEKWEQASSSQKLYWTLSLCRQRYRLCSSLFSLQSWWPACTPHGALPPDHLSLFVMQTASDFGWFSCCSFQRFLAHS